MALTAGIAAAAPMGDPRPTAVSNPGLPVPSTQPAEYGDKVQWFRRGLSRQPKATALALLASYTGTILALWGALAGLILGGLVGGGFISTNSFTSAVGLGGGVSIFAILASGSISAGVGFAWVYLQLFVHNPLAALMSIVAGAICTVATVAVIAALEGDLLTLRGYRRPSRDEARLLSPLVIRVGVAMNLGAYPRFAIWDSASPGAWTHMRHIVISTGLLQTLEPDQLEAVIAHEMHHWRSGDCMGQRIVWAASLPIALMYNLGCVLSGRNKPAESNPPSGSGPARAMATFIGWVLFWPSAVLMRCLIAPAAASRSRACEYEADAAAASIGLAPSLIAALRQIALFEPGRSGWEQVMTASHPPTELRIEALQAPRSDDRDFEEGPLGHLEF
jgi:Zn-dependent protease with chaperone function